VVPALIQKHPMLQSAFGSVTITEARGEVFASFEVSQSIFHWKQGARVAEEIPLPTVRRKGVRPSLFDELLQDPSKASTLAFDRSIPQLLSEIGPRILALVTLDGRFEKTSFLGAYSLTVVDLDRRRVCADLQVPAPQDPLPRITLRGDTLIVLQQSEDTRGQPAATIRRFHIRTEGCEWKALPRSTSAVDR